MMQNLAQSSRKKVESTSHTPKPMEGVANNQRQAKTTIDYNQAPKEEEAYLLGP